MISTTYQYLFSFPSHSCAARRHETFMPRPTLNLRRLPPANLHISALARHELLELLACAPSRSGGSMACRPASVTGRPADWCQVHLRNESATGDTMSATSGDGGGEAVRSRYATRRLLSPGGDRSSSLPKGPQLKFPAQRTTTLAPRSYFYENPEQRGVDSSFYAVTIRNHGYHERVCACARTSLVCVCLQHRQLNLRM